MPDTEFAVALGRIEENVKYIREDTEKSSANFISYQITANAEFDKVHERLNGHGTRLTQLETSLKTYFKVLGAVMTLAVTGVTIIVQIVSRMIWG